LGILNPAISGSWNLRSSQGKAAAVPVKGVISTNSFIALKGLVAMNEGIALLPNILCKEELLRKEFIHVLPGWGTSPEPIHLIYPPLRFETPKVRKMLPLLEARLRELHTF
jgi:DNA-binding transcriptional LysR family regulator